MLSHANRLHGCCRITSFSNDTGDTVSCLLLSRKRPGAASTSHPGSLLCRGMTCVWRGSLGIVGREAERAVSVLLRVLLKRKLYKRAEAFCQCLRSLGRRQIKSTSFLSPSKTCVPALPNPSVASARCPKALGMRKEGPLSLERQLTCCLTLGTSALSLAEESPSNY